MKFRNSLSALIFALALSLGTPSLEAQQGCPPPPFAGSAKARERNIFSEQQESDLGDAIAEHAQRNFRVIEDDIAATLRRVADNVLRQLPPTNIRFQFFLVDLPTVNAYAVPGGRVYVTRKLVVASRSEDELAGVLAHELGHIVTRQTAVDTSEMFRKVLGTTVLGDRKDIFEKYHQFLENLAKSKGKFGQSSGDSNAGQIEADQVALYLAAKAGYTPQSYPKFWDRIADTKGKTGSGLSDFFGATKPEERRLREMLKMADALPAACRGPRAALPLEEYQKWQAAVVAYSGLGRKESLHAILAKRRLDPPLQDDISHLRFSGDGKYVIAQEDSSIYVLSRDPFATLFRIDAPDAFPAQFTPDGKSVVFHRPDLRVERWEIEDGERADVREMTLTTHCMQTALSPDGKYLACLNVGFDLLLYEVATGQQVFQKKEFWMPRTFAEFFLFFLTRLSEGESFSLINMAFSPDAHYFIAARGETSLALELPRMNLISLPGSVKKHLKRTFAFLGPDRVFGVNPDNPKGPAALLRFPSGEVLSEVEVGSAMISAPGHGNFVLLRPIEKFPVGVMNLDTKKIFLANRTTAIDMHDKFSVSERRSGTLGLYSTDATGPIGEITLPRSTLGKIRASALSPDMKYLALSQRSRGGVWNLEKGDRLFHVRGFRGAYFGGGTLYADFPKFQETEREIGRLQLSTGQIFDGQKVEESDAAQYGEFLVLLKPTKKGSRTDKDVTLVVQEARSGKEMWTRAFPKESPGTYIGADFPSMVLWWKLDASYAKDVIKNDPALNARLANMREKEGDYLLEVVEARTGKSLGKMLVETGKGSFRIVHAYAVGDHVVIGDSSNRVLVFSLSTGEEKGKVFGARVAVSGAGNLFCVENETGQLTVYDMARMEAQDKFSFSHPVSLTRFSADGKRLFVLTNNQTTYVLDMSKAIAAASQ